MEQCERHLLAAASNCQQLTSSASCPGPGSLPRARDEKGPSSEPASVFLSSLSLGSINCFLFLSRERAWASLLSLLIQGRDKPFWRKMFIAWLVSHSMVICNYHLELASSKMIGILPSSFQQSLRNWAWYCNLGQITWSKMGILPADEISTSNLPSAIMIWNWH